MTAIDSGPVHSADAQVHRTHKKSRHNVSTRCAGYPTMKQTLPEEYCNTRCSLTFYF